MVAQEGMNLAGMIVGSITPHSPPLVYALHYSDALEYETEIVRFAQHDTSEEVLRVLKRTLGARIIDIWENESAPCWYYVQLVEQYPTYKVGNWSLPVTVYFAQWKRHDAV